MTPKTASTQQDKQSVYDLIMAQIEPELLSSQVDGLSAKYAGETPAENRKRKQRYERAFAEYDKREQAYLTALHSGTATVKHDILARAERAETAREKPELLALETALTSPPLFMHFLLDSNV